MYLKMLFISDVQYYIPVRLCTFGVIKGSLYSKNVIYSIGVHLLSAKTIFS